MIYTNPYPPERAIDDGEEPAMHVWLEGMVDEEALTEEQLEAVRHAVINHE